MRINPVNPVNPVYLHCFGMSDLRKTYRAPLAAFWGCLMLLHICSGVMGCKRQVNDTGYSQARVDSSEQHYAHLFGQRYRTKVDLYLFIFTEDPDCKYLGSNDRARFPTGSLPPAVSRQHIGKVNGDVKILDVVPAGSELVIEAETHEVTAFSGIRGTSGFPMGFICRLAYNGKQFNGILSEFIQSHEEVSIKIPNQDIDEKIAVRVDP